MKIIGLTGAIGSGKTTLARLLDDAAASSMHYESWMLVAEVANDLRRQKTFPSPDDTEEITTWLQALPEIVRKRTNTVLAEEMILVTPRKLEEHPEHYQKLLEYLELQISNPELGPGTITEANKESHRAILQWLGGYLVYAVGPGIWYDEILRRVTQNPGTELITVGGVRYPGDAERIVHAGGIIVRVERPDITAKDGTDLTERERSSIKADTVVVNDGGLEQLADCAQRIYSDLSSDTLRPEYVCSQATATP